ncbi:hypothetical protein BJV82DRAFT_596837 [Fennellomyces sp. T-0311]|nr:hypothetical protein BJV82DRAFT_596837 [Fennellomyces sp. T-0311]
MTTRKLMRLVAMLQSSSSKKRSHSVTSSSTIPQASSSNSASTDSTNKRRRKITNFLSGKGSQVIQLGPNTDKWVVNENEITVALLKFRAGVIERAQRGTLTTYQEELAINCIFVIDGLNSVYPSSELMYGFDDNTWQAMVDECNSRYPLQQLSDATEAALLKFAKAGKRKFADCTSTVNIITNEYICEALRNITRTYSPTSAKKSDANESTFSISTVHPFILPFLEETELTRLKGTDGEAYGSKRTKKNGGFSDLSVNFECGMMPSQGLLIVEIKPPHKVKNGSRPDLVKLGNEMKDALDKMVKDGIDDKEITVIGVLIEGFRCTIFVMDLMYQATYRLIPLSIFYLPRDRHDFDCLGNTFEALVTMRVSKLKGRTFLLA